MEKQAGRRVSWMGEGSPSGGARAAEQKQEIQDQLPSPEVLELRQELGFIDFDILRGLYVDLYDSFGLPTTKLNFFRLNAISPNKYGGFGKYHAENNSLGVDTKLIRGEMAREGIGAEVFLAGVVIHEETHAVGRVECVFLPESSGSIKRSIKLGYSLSIPLPADDGWARSRVLFHDINEGVTEIIAYKILQAYQKKTAQFKEGGVEAYIALRSSEYEPVGKTIEFMRMLSKRTGTSYERIEEMVIEGYFTASNFLEEMYRTYPDLPEPEILAKVAEG